MIALVGVFTAFSEVFFWLLDALVYLVTARQSGSENLTKPNIAKAIIEAKQARSERTQIDADWLLKRLLIRGF